MSNFLHEPAPLADSLFSDALHLLAVVRFDAYQDSF